MRVGPFSPAAWDHQLVCGAGRVRAGAGPSPCDQAGLVPSIRAAAIKSVFLDVMVLSRLLLGRSRPSRQLSLPHLFMSRFYPAAEKAGRGWAGPSAPILIPISWACRAMPCAPAVQAARSSTATGNGYREGKMRKLTLLLALLPAAAMAQTPAFPTQEPKPEWTEFWSPVPPKVESGAALGQPPSDATMLFNGRDLSGWESANGGPADWGVENCEMV